MVANFRELNSQGRDLGNSFLIREDSEYMRVARLIDLYSSTFTGGGQTHVRELSKVLENQDCHNVIFSQANPSLKARTIWNIIVIGRVITAHFKQPFDLIHSHGHSAGVPAWIIGKLIRRPVIHTVHGSHLMDQHLRGIKASLEHWALTQIPYDAIISDSQSFLQYRTKARKTAVIPNGIFLETYDAVADPQKELTPTILFIGRLEPVKGIDILIEALGEIVQETKDWQLWIMGQGPLQKVLRRRIQELGLKKQITFIGNQHSEQYIKTIKRAHVFVLPSLAEGQPISLLDSWACKIPVLVTTVGHNPFVVQEDKNGWLVKPGSKTALIGGIRKVFKQKARWQAMGLSGYKKIQFHHQWYQIGSKVYQVYNSVL